MRAKFEDKRPDFDPGSHYVTPNESVMTWHNIAKKMKPSKSGGICSSGEVLLLGLLPHSENVVAVDHSRASLKTAMLKALILEHHDGAAIKKLCDGPQYNGYDFPNIGLGKLGDVFMEIASDLPESLKNRYPAVDRLSYFAIARLWKSLPDASFDAARERLDQVTFVHGDLRDLKEYGEFDLFYASNAMEHTAFDKKMPKVEDFNGLVKREKFLLCATTVGPKLTPGWKIHECYQRGILAALEPEEISWEYQVVQWDGEQPEEPTALELAKKKRTTRKTI